MAEQDAAHLSPSSAAGDDADHNSVDSFPRLVETPATMSPVPSHERNQPPSATLLQHHQSKLANGDIYGPQGTAEQREDAGEEEADEDSSWSTDSDGDDELSTLRAIASSGTDPIDSRSIYQALFGGGLGGRGGGVSAGGGPPQRSLGAQSGRKLPELPVYKLALGRADIDSCVKIEEACFPNDGASREDITYRITQASGLNMGLFTTAYAQSASAKLPTYATSTSSETTSNRRTVLVAYICVTLTTNDRITKEDLVTPKGWQSSKPKADEKLGHQAYGKTVIVHSFGVLPELQRQNIGTCLWKTFLQIVKGSKHYTRIAIAVPTTQVAWFKKHKFRTLGSSVLDAGPDAPKVDMVIDYHEDDDSDEEDDEEDGDHEELGAVYGTDPISSDDEDDDESQAAEDQLTQES